VVVMTMMMIDEKIAAEQNLYLTFDVMATANEQLEMDM
jgi:hypothetical protein